MIDVSRFFDHYSRQARLYPALLTILPLLASLLATFPQVLTVGESIIGIAAACGLFYFLSDLARSRGKKIEPRLVKAWGGMPTTVWLRHSGNHLSADVKRRYHAVLSSKPIIGALPSEQDERANPTLADERYTSAATWLREQTRTSSFSLIARENAAYGFRRNLLGLKPVAIVLALVALAVPVVGSFLTENQGQQHKILSLGSYLSLTLPEVGTCVLALVFLLGWLAVVSRSWVKEAGDQYACALLASCDVLP